MNREDAETLLQQLEGNRTPPARLNGAFGSFTVGRSRNIANKIYKRIPKAKAHFVELITGSYGSGKTHTLNFLEELIINSIRDNSPNSLDYNTTALMRLDLNAGIETVALLQTNLVSSLSVFSDSDKLQAYDALRYVYNQIKKKHLQNLYDRLNSQAKVRDLLRDIAGIGVGSAYPFGTVLHLLATARYDEWEKNRIVHRDTTGEIGELTNSLTAIQMGFVESFISNGESKTNYIAEYDDLFANASTNWEYLDVLLKILRSAGYTHVIMLIDEAEKLTSGFRGDSEVQIEEMALLGARMLEKFHSLHQKIGRLQDQYPAVIQVITIPESSLAKIRRINPALMNVWEGDHQVHHLENVSNIKAIVLKISEIMLHAGYELPYMSFSIQDNIEKEILNQLKEKGQISTMRNVIPKVIRSLRSYARNP